MEIHTTRFGCVEIVASDVIEFPNAMLGLEDCTRWVLLADADNSSLGWLQSTTRAEIALAVVSPRSFVPDYKLRVARGELVGVTADAQDVHVLVIVSKQEDSITLNLKAPLIFNLKRRLGRQVLANGEAPLRFELRRQLTPRKQAA